MKRKRILFLGQLPPPVHGVSIFNSWILSSQKLQENFSFDPVNLATAKTIADIGKQGLSKYFKFLKIFWTTFFKLLRTSYSAFYITLSPVGSAFIKDSALILLAKIFRIPVIIHLHGKGINNRLSNSSRLNKLYNFVFKDAYVIVLAETLKTDIENITSYAELFILHNGVPENSFDNKNYSKEVNILHLSNMIESKGSLDLLKAAKLLKADGVVGFKLWFVGNWDSNEFEHRFNEYLISNNLADIAQYLGPKYKEEKHKILEKSHVFCLPTYYKNECFPLTILEAMNAGLAIVSTKEGAIPEIIEDAATGFVIEARSPGKLAETLKTTIQDPALLQRLGTKAQEVYRQEYTFSTFESNLLHIFNKVLS